MSDMKCPFCQQELERDYDKIQCPDINCRHKHDWYGSYDLWQELIRTRKALDVAVDALNKCHETFTESEALIVANKHNRIANKALEQITALKQKDVK